MVWAHQTVCKGIVTRGMGGAAVAGGAVACVQWSAEVSRFRAFRAAQGTWRRIL